MEALIQNKEENFGKRTKIGPFWVFSFMKLSLVNPCLDQKKLNCFDPPPFFQLNFAYASIAVYFFINT